MDRFVVNLQCGTNKSSDIALHFNPRYVGNSGHVVCNTLQNSCWGSEQKTKNTPLPRGSDFTLSFLVNRDSYSVWMLVIFFFSLLYTSVIIPLYLFHYSFTFHPSLNPFCYRETISLTESITDQCIYQVILLTCASGDRERSPLPGVPAPPPRLPREGHLSGRRCRYRVHRFPEPELSHQPERISEASSGAEGRKLSDPSIRLEYAGTSAAREPGPGGCLLVCRCE